MLKHSFLFIFILISCINISAQNVGIGTTTPKRTFVVKNASPDSNAVVTELASSNGDPNFHLVTTKGSTLNVGGAVVTKIGLLWGDDNDNLNSFIRFHRGSSAKDGFMSFSTNQDVERMRINSAGNVGIGSVDPSAKLNVDGNTKTQSLQITNGAFKGYLLKSDSLGNTSWINPATLILTETDPKVGSVTTNKVPKWNGTKLADGLLFDNGTNVGIGTTNPQRSFVVKNTLTTEDAVVAELTSSIGDPNFHLVTTKGDVSATIGNAIVAKIGVMYGDDNANPNSFLRFHRSSGTNNGYMSFSTNNDEERMRITSLGRVGINTTSPQGEFHVQSNTQLGTVLDASNRSLGMHNDDEGYWHQKTAWQSFTDENTGMLSKIGFYWIGGPYYSWETPVTGKIKIYAGEGVDGKILGTVPFSITYGNNGNSLLYNVSPTIPVIPGNKYTMELIFDEEMRYYAEIDLTAGFSYLDNNIYTSGTSNIPSTKASSTDLQFQVWVARTGDVDALVVTNGRVGIGTTSPTEILDVAGTTKTTDLTVTADANVTGFIQSKGYKTRAGTAGPFADNYFNFNWTGNQLHAWVDGVFIGAGVTSDRRLKENIVPLTNDGISTLMKLKPVSFKYKTIDGSIFRANPITQDGFIADELQAIIPSAVNGEKDAVAANGQIQPQTVNALPIVSILTKAVQEQQVQIELLQQQIIELKNMMQEKTN